MDYLLEIDEYNRPQMTFNAAADIRNNIILSLFVKKGEFFVAPWFGSQLHEIKTATVESCRFVETYCNDATKWMITVGKIVSFTTSASVRTGGSGIDILCTATLPSGSPISYKLFHRIA